MLWIQPILTTFVDFGLFYPQIFHEFYQEKVKMGGVFSMTGTETGPQTTGKPVPAHPWYARHNESSVLSTFEYLIHEAARL